MGRSSSVRPVGRIREGVPQTLPLAPLKRPDVVGAAPAVETVSTASDGANQAPSSLSAEPASNPLGARVVGGQDGLVGEAAGAVLGRGQFQDGAGFHHGLKSAGPFLLRGPCWHRAEREAGKVDLLNRARGLPDGQGSFKVGLHIGLSVRDAVFEHGQAERSTGVVGRWLLIRTFEGRGLVGVRPGDCVGHETAIVSVLGHRADLVEGPAQGHRPGPGDSATGRAQAGEAATAAGGGDAAPGFGADGERHEPRGGGRARPRRAAPAPLRRLPGVQPRHGQAGGSPCRRPDQAC